MKEKKWLNRTKAIILLLALFLCCSFFAGKASAKEADDFAVKKGVLTKYTGTDTRVVIPQNVTEIGTDAFRSNQTITELVLHKNIKKIGKRAFYNCKRLSSIVFPEGLQTIGEEAFYHCIALKKAEFPNSMKSIGDSAFEKCKRIEKLSFPDKKISFGETVFSGIKRGNAGEFGQFVVANKSELIQYLETAAETDIRIPDGVTYIHSDAFVFSGDIELLRIPGSVKSIKAEIFDNSTIFQISLEEGVEELEDNAFAGCDEMEAIFIPSSVTKIGKNIFSEQEKDLLTIFCQKNSMIEHYAKANHYANVEYN